MDIAALLRQRAAMLETLHDGFSEELLQAVDSSEIAEFFLSRDAAAQGEAKVFLDLALLFAQGRFKTQEMCLIDHDGAEISRTVDGQVSQDLTIDESGAVFFAPGLNRPRGSVYVSPPYLSPDAKKWVIGYATPIWIDGTVRRLLHFEHGLDLYQSILDLGDSNDNRIVLAVTADGWVVSDSRRRIAVEASDGDTESEGPGAFFDRFQFGGVTFDELRRMFGKGVAGEGVWNVAGEEWKIALHVVRDLTLVGLSRAAASDPLPATD